MTDPDVTLLNALARSEEVRLDALAVNAGVSQRDAVSHIERLVALGYAVRIAGSDGTSVSYRAVARALGL